MGHRKIWGLNVYNGLLLFSIGDVITNLVVPRFDIETTGIF